MGFVHFHPVTYIHGHVILIDLTKSRVHYVEILMFTLCLNFNKSKC